MRSVYAIWRMMARRSIANWRLAVTLVLGMLVAATLLASAPIYARAMADLGLTFAIRDRLQSAPATQVELRDVPIAAADGRRLQDAVRQRAEERIGWFTGARERVMQGPRFLIAAEGQRPAERPPVAVPQFFSSAEANVRVLEGRLPAPQTGADGRRVLELALSPRAAEAGGLRPGDRITLVEHFDDCAREIPREGRPPPPPCTPTAAVRFSLPAQVVGIIEPIDPEAPVWNSRAAARFDPYRLDVPDFGPLLPMLTDEDSFVAGLGGTVPQYRAAFTWNYFADPQQLSRTNYQRARADIVALRDDLRPVGGFAFSPLEGVLDGFGRELRFQQTPLLLLLLQVAGIALFYVGVVAAMVVERQADEIALLRARGAGRWQVTGVYALEGLTVAALVTLAAPPLAGLATGLLGRTPTFARVTGGAPLPVHIGPEAFALAALGAALSLLMLVIPAFVAAGRSGATSRRQAARPGIPFFRRYYLDLAVAALAAILLWELHERGSVFTPSATGGVSSDPLLLLSPALLMLGAAALLLRFYPVLLRGVARAMAAAAGVVVVMGLWQVVRNPGQYTRLALLLMMAVAVGTFAASYSSTAERSFRDRASFEAGVDLRVTSSSLDAGTRVLTGELSGIAGVARAVPVLRGSVSPATPGSGQQGMALLALDPDAADLLWFRDDLADLSLPELMGLLRGPAPRGRPLPGSPTALSVWVNPTQPRENVTMWARVRDAAGATAMIELGRLDFSGWRQLRAPLAGDLAPAPAPPLAVVSLVFSEPPNVSVTANAPVYIDDLAAEGPEGVTVVEDFEGTIGWEAAPSRAPARGGSVQDEFKISTEQRHGGLSAGRFQFRTGVSTGLRGIFVKDPSVPLSVVVSPEVLAITGAQVGQTTLLAAGDTLIPVVVRGTARLFPTVAAGTPFVLANRDQVIAWAATFSDQALRQPNEVWLGLSPDADRAAVQRALATSRFRLGNAVDRAQVLRSVNANPLIAAGGSGILLSAFLAVFLLVGVALVVTLATSVQRRRTEFAVMRAMGVSRGQLFRLLAFEYAVVAVVGLTAGVFLGRTVGRRMLSFLDVTETGTSVAPPFVLQTNWGMVAAALAAIVLTFVAAVVVGTGVLRRQAAGQALRQAE